MKQYIGVFRESISLFSTSALKKWIVIVIVTCVIFVLRVGSGGGHLENLFGIARYIGYLFAFGIPFIVGASFLFGSQETQNNIVDSIRKSRNVRFARLFIPYIVMTLLMMTLAVMIGFVFIIPSLNPIQLMSYLSSLLVSTLVVSLLVCPIAAFLALIIDDWKTSAFLGVLLFFAITLATGSPGFPVNYPEIAFLGPAHILTAMLFILIGGFSEYLYAVDNYVGVDFVPIQLVLPITLFIVIAIVSYVSARKMFHSNLSRWTIERDLWLSTKGGKMERWLDTEDSVPDKVQSPSKIDLTDSQAALKQRRRRVTAILVSAILLIPMGGMSYVTVQQNVQQNEWTTVVYETSGVTMELGIDWLFGEVTGMDHPDSILLSVGCVGGIVGGNGGSASFNFGHRRMTLVEYLQLNETEHEDLFGSGISENNGYRETFTSGWGGPIHEQTYVWVLRFLEVGGQTEGSISISFQVIIRPT